MPAPAPIAFLTGSPGPGELILLFVVILVLFGPRRLPEIARMIGKTLEDLRRASHDFRDQIMRIEEQPAPEPSDKQRDRSDTGGLPTAGTEGPPVPSKDGEPAAGDDEDDGDDDTILAGG